MTLNFSKWSRPTLILSGLVLGSLAGLIANDLVTSPEALARLGWWLNTIIQPVGKLLLIGNWIL